MLFQKITCKLTPILWIAGKSKKLDFLIGRRRLCTTKLINRSCRVRPESRNTFHYRHSAVISDKGKVIFIEIPIPYYHHSIWPSHNFFIHTKRECWSKYDEKHSFCFHSPLILDASPSLARPTVGSVPFYWMKQPSVVSDRFYCTPTWLTILICRYAGVFIQRKSS